MLKTKESLRGSFVLWVGEHLVLSYKEKPAADAADDGFSV
jgi:hypothetical protein